MECDGKRKAWLAPSVCTGRAGLEKERQICGRGQNEVTSGDLGACMEARTPRFCTRPFPLHSLTQMLRPPSVVLSRQHHRLLRVAGPSLQEPESLGAESECLSRASVAPLESR